MGGKDIIIISLYHWVDTTCPLVQVVEHLFIYQLFWKECARTGLRSHARWHSYPIPQPVRLATPPGSTTPTLHTSIFPLDLDDSIGRDCWWIDLFVTKSKCWSSLQVHWNSLHNCTCEITSKSLFLTLLNAELHVNTA